VLTDSRPYSLTPDMVRDALKPARSRLAQCLAADPAKVRSARASMVVNGDGRVEGVFVTPTTLQACVEAAVQEARFPITRLGRQRISHVLYGPNATSAVTPDGDEPAKSRKPTRKEKAPARPAKRAQAAPAAAPAPKK
jgi:hypothetical protein